MPDDRETRKVPAMSDGAMLDAVRKMFDGFASEVREEVGGIRTLSNEVANRMVAAHEGTRREVAKLASMTKIMWRDQYGDAPPPPPEEHASAVGTGPHPVQPGAKPRVPRPLTDRERQMLTDHDNDIAGLHGQVIVMDAKMNELLELQKEQMGKHDDDTRGTLQRMLDGVQWVFTNRAGRKYLLTLIAALSGTITAAGTTYALMSGRLPYPNQAPHYLPAPPPPASDHAGP